MPTEWVFLWLAQLSVLVGPFTNPDCIESKSFSHNCGKSNGNMSNRVNGEKFVTKEELVTEKKLVMEEELVTEEKLEIEKEIETEDLEGLE